MAHRVAALLVTVPVLVMLSACGRAPRVSEPPGTAARPPHPSGSSSPDPLRPPTAGIPPSVSPSPVRTLRGGRADGLVTMPWIFTRLEDGGRRIVIGFRTSSCVREVGVVVEESPSAVSVGPRGRLARDVCALVLPKPVYRVIRLSAPLGDRTLLHLPVDRVFSSGGG